MRTGSCIANTLICSHDSHDTHDTHNPGFLFFFQFWMNTVIRNNKGYELKNTSVPVSHITTKAYVIRFTARLFDSE